MNRIELLPKEPYYINKTRGLVKKITIGRFIEQSSQPIFINTQNKLIKLDRGFRAVNVLDGPEKKYIIHL